MERGSKMTRPIRNRVKTKAEQESLRQSGGILATVLRRVSSQLAAGQTTHELDVLARHELKALGGKSPFLEYVIDSGVQPFPGVLCVSVNDEVVHGVPSRRELVQGDVVGLDFGVDYQGMITDGAITVVVGGLATSSVERLLTATSQALNNGIAQVKAGARVGDISAAIEQRLRRDSLGIVRELSGHGVGDSIHEEPTILNYGRAGTGMRLEAGMSLAIEPMATLGDRRIKIDADGWTIRTADGSIAAQFEHSVLVTEDGCEILTR